MIDKKALTEFVEQQLEGTDYFLVSVSVSANNEIKVEIDSMGNADIDFCIALSRKIEEAFSREEEDYELEVGSAGLTSPLKVPQQYKKNIGNEVEVLARDGKKYTGVLDACDDEGFTIITRIKEKLEGAKRPVERAAEMHFGYDDAKSVKYVFRF